MLKPPIKSNIKENHKIDLVYGLIASISITIFVVAMFYVLIS